MTNDLISRRKAFEYFVTLWNCIGTIMDRDEWEDICMTTANEIPSAQPDKDMIHLQKEQAYMQGWEDGQNALREEMWEDGRDRLD